MKKTTVHITVDAANIDYGHNGSLPYGGKVKILCENGLVIYGYMSEIEVQQIHEPDPIYYADSAPGAIYADPGAFYAHAEVKYPLPKFIDGGYKSAPSEVSQADTFAVLEAAIPGIKDRTAVCPGCESLDSLTQVIVHLNDSHHWSREKIADWLEESGLALPINTQPQGEES